MATPVRKAHLEARATHLAKKMGVKSLGARGSSADMQSMGGRGKRRKRSLHTSSAQSGSAPHTSDDRVRPVRGAARPTFPEDSWKDREYDQDPRLIGGESRNDRETPHSPPRWEESLEPTHAESAGTRSPDRPPTGRARLQGIVERYEQMMVVQPEPHAEGEDREGGYGGEEDEGLAHRAGGFLTSDHSDEEDDAFLHHPFGQVPAIATDDCFLCREFSTDSDSHVIRSMWDLFWSEFWGRSFPYLAVMLHTMWERDIYDQEVEINGNARGLHMYTWEDFHHHIVHPEHMGCDPRVMQRKLIQRAARNIERCDKYLEYIDPKDGQQKVDCRVLECQTRASKHITDLYRLDPKDMIGYSGKAVTDVAQFGGFTRRF